MPNSATRELYVPAFSYRGFSVPGMALDEEFIGEPMIYKTAYEFALESAPLSWMVALYEVGGGLARQEPFAGGLPDAVKEAGRKVYGFCQSRPNHGVWHRDGVRLLRGSEKPRGVIAPDGFVPAKYFREIEGFELDGHTRREITLSDNTEVFDILLPEGDAFVVPTNDGVYNPHTGTPFETVKDEDEAVRRWLDAGLTESQVRLGLSKFYREKESGAFAVYSWSSHINGPFCVNMLRSPGYSIFRVSSLRARRATEAGRDTENGAPESDEA